MGILITLLTTVIISGLIATALVFFSLRYFRSALANVEEIEYINITTTSGAYDVAIESALERISHMLPFSDRSKLLDDLSTLTEKFDKENEQLQRVETTLTDAQAAVDEKEASHNKLKMGKEDCAEIAADLKARREELQAEYERLESQLKESRLQVNELNSDTELTDEQLQAIMEIEAALVNTTEHLDGLVQVYKQATGRFLNLQGQHEMLEFEYRGLVEKQLSGIP